MRSPLAKRIPRDLKRNMVKYLGMILILIITISIGSSFQATLKSAVSYLDGIVEGNLQEDGYFETAKPLSDQAKEHFQNEGVEVCENFYATENEYEDASKVLFFQERSEIDIPTVFEGKLPEKEDEIAIDHVFARTKKIGIGDTVILLKKQYQVCGTVSLPDYSSLFMNNTDLVMNTAHFGVAVLDESGFEQIDQKHLTYRYSYRFADRTLRSADKTDKEEAMAKYLFLHGCGLQDFLPREINQSISFLEMDIGSDGPMMTVFVYLLIALIAFIFAVLTSNTIEQEAVIIGTLRASGYTKGEIIWHYLQPTFIIAIAGSVIGNILGYTVMIRPFLDIYYTTYSVGPLRISFDYATFILTTILPVVIMIGINYVMLRRKLSLSPLKFLRKELKKGKLRKAVKLPEFSFLNRFRLRVIIQNKGSYCILFFGVFFASFLLMFGIGLKPLMDHYTDTIDQTLPFEYQYILKLPVSCEGTEEVFLYSMDTWFALGKKDIGVTCYGIEKDSAYFGDAYPEEGITVSSALAKKLNLKTGDTLTLKDGNREEEHEFTVTKVFSYDAAMAMFMDKQELNTLAGVSKGSFNCLISDEKPDIDERFIAKRITRADMLGAGEQMMDSFGTILGFINIFSVIVYMIFLYILTKVVIDKNAVSIAYMKVFGYDDREIRKLYLTATTMVVMVSLVVCIPLEIFLFKGCLVFLSSTIEGYMEFFLPKYIYLEIILIGILVYFGINAIHMNEVKKIPMSEALKNRE